MTEKAIKILSALPLFIAAAMSALFASCADDFPIDDYVIRDGMSNVTATVDFHPLITTENEPGPGGRGAAGNAIANITDPTVFLYDANGHLLRIISVEDLEDYNVTQKDSETGSPNTDMPNDAGGQDVQGEKTTSRATFTLKDIPFGRYYLYCVANMGRIENSEENLQKFHFVKDLQKTLVEWDETDMTKNAQMFGYFTLDGNDTNTSNGFDAPLVPINQTRTRLHSWIKRAASKVTVAFDGSGLHNGIWVYIKSVTIKDIPRYCKIGATNSVHTLEADSMIINGDKILYNTKGELQPGEKQGETTKDWLMVTKGNGIQGAVKVEDGDTIVHSEYNQALYFYENMQGNYKDAVNKTYYNKKPDWNNVGWTPKPDQYDYKDNVKYGSYIEVDAYYVSNNEDQVSHGDIKYRFMLGQDDTYDYNAIRNHHYKLTLGFRGWANQPDWHIEYVEPETEFFIDPTYYVSYRYNTRSEFPVRFVGDVEEFVVEIVENNWAPFDSKPTGGSTGSAKTDSVPPQIVRSNNIYEKDFQWNRPVYEGSPVKNSNLSTYYYGLKNPLNYNGKSDTTYYKPGTSTADPLAPTKVTAIWAGFLSLHADAVLKAFRLENETYYENSAMAKLKADYYDNHRNRRIFTKKDLTFPGWKAGTVMTKWVDSDHKEVAANATNNACEIVKAADGSLTVKVPMWTQPKTMLGISGFTGNNPYDTYQRKATVSLTAKQKKKDGSMVTITKYMPVKQVRRVVNPKGVWRKWDDNTPFTVSLVRREGAADDVFNTFTSEGAWRAYIKASNNAGFITLSGAKSDGAGGIMGDTGTPIEFKINFNGGAKDKSYCAIIEIEYHGLTCKHSIFVRQGYMEPLDIKGTAKWSSFSLFKCANGTPFKKQWDPSEPLATRYIQATLTANPLSLGTFFKRGNYNGIPISNNETFGSGVGPGKYGLFTMSDESKLVWGQIEGLAFSTGYTGTTLIGGINSTFAWGRFQVSIADDDNPQKTTTHNYRVPTYEEYKALLDADYGVGVVYGDGASETATTVTEAYGYEDVNNDNNGGKGSSRGMRGIIVYNPSNAHQLFFPIGARGMGRRTITGFKDDSYDLFGKLRYGGVKYLLTQDVSIITTQSSSCYGASANQFRPIPYNMPNAPGAIYWINELKYISKYCCPIKVG